MGGSSQPKNTTTTTQVNLPSWLSNDYQNLINQAQGINNKPYQQYGGPTVANLTPDQYVAIQQAGAGAGGYLNVNQQMQAQNLGNVVSGAYSVDPSANPYLGQNTQLNGNPYAGQNPYLGQMVNQAQQSIVNNYKNSVAPSIAAQFAQGGAFGGSAYNDQLGTSQQNLGTALGNISTSLYGQDYQNQQQLAENSINRQVQAQQTDLARNAGLYQQGIQNQLSAANQNASNILGASQAITGANALQSQFLGQYGNLAGLQQQYQQGLYDTAANNWYNQNYGYDQQKLANYGNALNSVQGAFQGQTQTGLNPAYKPRSTGGALASAAGGAATGMAVGGPWGAAVGGGIGLLGYYI